MQIQKTAAAIHDISGFGKCSLTVALPIISACGITTAVVPTALLSTHTGGFTGYTYKDLNSEIYPIAKHWAELKLDFDAVYTGFLGSFEQVELVIKAYDLIKNSKTMLVVDPAMADNGKLYTLFDMAFAMEMKKLCAKADIITPNITEACLITGFEYKEGPYTKEYIEALLKELSKIGAKKIVLTGVCFDDKKLGSAGMDCETGDISYALVDRIDGMYHGTGDVFSSALVGALLNGKDLNEAMLIAARFTANSIKRTLEAKTDIRFGVAFEQEIPDLINMLGLK